jgi:lysozyme
MTNDLKPSGACRALVRQFERCYLQAYLCPAGVPTIGVGHTRGVKLGDRCSQEQADVWLTQDLEEAAAAVSSLVRVPLTQGQFDALTSFVFNLGIKRLAESTLLILLNKGNYAAAADQFSRWVYAGTKKLPGLVTRRAAEAALFLKSTSLPTT